LPALLLPNRQELSIEWPDLWADCDVNFFTSFALALNEGNEWFWMAFASNMRDEFKAPKHSIFTSSLVLFSMRTTEGYNWF